MPVLATIATITLLTGGGSSAGPFLDPVKFREMLGNAKGDISDNELEFALTIVDELESGLENYSSNVERSMEAYAEELLNPKTDADDLIKRLAPIDRERTAVLKSIIDYRRQLLDTFDESSWAAVFD